MYCCVFIYFFISNILVLCLSSCVSCGGGGVNVMFDMVYECLYVTLYP